MKISQISIIVSSIVVIIVLYNLPKVVVNDDSDEKISGTKQNDNKKASAQGQNVGHAGELDNETKKLIVSLRKKLQSTAGKQKKIKFADSLASIFKQNANYDSAAYYYAKIAEQDPSKENILKSANNYFKAFNNATSAGKTKLYGKKARDYYDQILKNNPDNLDLKAKKAMTIVATKNPMQGVRMLTGILKKDSLHELSLLYLGMLSIQSGQNEKAKKRLTKLLDHYPDNLKARLYLGMAYKNLNKTKLARKQFNIVRDNSNDPFLKSNAEGYLKNL